MLSEKRGSWAPAAGTQRVRVKRERRVLLCLHRARSSRSVGRQVGGTEAFQRRRRRTRQTTKRAAPQGARCRPACAHVFRASRRGRGSAEPHRPWRSGLGTYLGGERQPFGRLALPRTPEGSVRRHRFLGQEGDPSQDPGTLAVSSAAAARVHDRASRLGALRLGIAAARDCLAAALGGIAALTLGRGQAQVDP